MHFRNTTENGLYSVLDLLWDSLQVTLLLDTVLKFEKIAFHTVVGITGIIRAYVATSSKLHERHRAIAQTTAAQSLGMTAGPSKL